jgi:hypothetical protein
MGPLNENHLKDRLSKYRTKWPWRSNHRMQHDTGTTGTPIGLSQWVRRDHWNTSAARPF